MERREYNVFTTNRSSRFSSPWEMHRPPVPVHAWPFTVARPKHRPHLWKVHVFHPSFFSYKFRFAERKVLWLGKFSTVVLSYERITVVSRWTSGWVSGGGDEEGEVEREREGSRWKMEEKGGKGVEYKLIPHSLLCVWNMRNLRRWVFQSPFSIRTHPDLAFARNSDDKLHYVDTPPVSLPKPVQLLFQV